MAGRAKLDKRIKTVVPKRDRWTQIGLRWLSVLASALVAVQVGKAVDGQGVTASWWAWTAGWAVVAAASGGLAVAESLRLQSQAERDLRRLTQESLFTLGSVRVQGRAGQLLDLASSGASRAARYRGGFLASSVASLSAPLIVLVVMGGAMGWRVAGLMTLVVVVGPLLIGAFQGMNKEVGDRFRASQSYLRERFLEGISALESLAYAGAAGSFADHLATTNEHHRRKIMKLLAHNQLLILVMDLVFSLGALVVATFLAVSERSAGELSVGSALTLLLLTIMLVAPIDLIGQFFYIGIGGRAAQRQFSALLTEADQAHRSDEAATSRASSNDVGSDNRGQLPRDVSATSVLQLRDVTAGWDESAPVLQDISLHVAHGERLALVGPSGSGKSTLSAVIQGLIKPLRGEVLVEGRPPEPHGDPSVAVVEQRAYLFNTSIAENLRLAKPDASEAELWGVLDKANLADDVSRMPAGLNTPVGDHGSRLSGGQAQRLAVARALLKDAPILILDEPTSQVDLKGEALIIEAIERASADRTVLTIAHRQAAVRRADRVLVVSEGRVR